MLSLASHCGKSDEKETKQQRKKRKAVAERQKLILGETQAQERLENQDEP